MKGIISFCNIYTHLVNLSRHIFLRTKQIHFSFIIFIIVFPWSDTPSEFILCVVKKVTTDTTLPSPHRLLLNLLPPPLPESASIEFALCEIYSSRENLAWILYCCYLSHIIKYFWTESSTMYYWMIKPKWAKNQKTGGILKNSSAKTLACRSIWKLSRTECFSSFLRVNKHRLKKTSWPPPRSL